MVILVLASLTSGASPENDIAHKRTMKTHAHPARRVTTPSHVVGLPNPIREREGSKMSSRQVQFRPATACGQRRRADGLVHQGPSVSAVETLLGDHKTINYQ
jgi:hypothetical protein